MNGEKHLIYLDILGFGELAYEIANKKGIEEREVRKKFIDVIKERVEIIETHRRIIGKKYGESDDWLLVTDSLDNVFITILEVLEHNTGYRGYERISLEIAIGTGEYDKWAKFEGKYLVIEEDTIKFLKTNIITFYHKWYRDKNNQSPKSTFVILTESAYEGLGPLDKKICKKISYKENGTEIIFFIADVNRVKQRGKVYEFLEKIGYAGSKLYGRIDEVYVPPFEYEDITNTLKEKRIVFISGTPEYGKTYTAVRLMWEYYKNGYEPRWIKGEELPERIEVRKKLEDIRAELKPRHIIYFEDPFGKIKYEKRESLERGIGIIIDSVKKVEDAYVIITSREEVFKEFEKENLSVDDLKEFKKKLNIKRPSYDYEKRKEILLMWAEEESCKWLGDEELKNFVLRSIWSRIKGFLPTPLSIRSFVMATINIEKEDELRKKIEEKSEETAKAFAREIKNMVNDKILFLSFLFISRFFEVRFVRETYQELVKELNFKDAREFDRVLNWFKGDKIEIFREYIRFSHPSYFGALEYLIREDRYKEIFSKLLLKLSEKNEAASDVALTVGSCYSELPENVRSLIFKLAEKNNKEIVGSAVWAIVRNYDEFPDVARNLLFKLAEKKRVAAVVVGVVANAALSTSDEHSEDMMKLLLELSEKDEAAKAVAFVVGGNFNEFPEDLRNTLLFKLSEKHEATKAVAFVVLENFEKFPDDARMTKWVHSKLQKPLQLVIKDLLRSGLWSRREVFKTIFSSKPWWFDLDFISEIFSEIIMEIPETVKIEAQERLRAYFDIFHYLKDEKEFENG